MFSSNIGTHKNQFFLLYKNIQNDDDLDFM